MNLKYLFGVCLLAVGINVSAQSSTDPVIMTIAGKPVLRSEFEYSYNKNNSARRYRQEDGKRVRSFVR